MNLVRKTSCVDILNGSSDPCIHIESFIQNNHHEFKHKIYSALKAVNVPKSRHA